MGGRSNKQVINFRATDEQKAEIDRLVSASGMSKQDYLLNAALGVNNDHTHLLLQAAPNIDIVKVNAASSIESSIKGDRARLVLLEAPRAKLKFIDSVDQPVAWHDGAVWMVSRSSNTSQFVLTKVVEYPLGLFSSLQKKLYSLQEAKAALAKWNKLSQLESIDRVTDNKGKSCLDQVAGLLFLDVEWEVIEKEATRKIAQLKPEVALEPSIAEPIAVDKVVKDGIAIEEPREACTPLNEIATEKPLTEPLQLTVAEFVARFGFVNPSDEYSRVAAAGKKDDGWLSPEGDRWFLRGSRKSKKWSMEVVNQQLELLKV